MIWSTVLLQPKETSGCWFWKFTDSRLVLSLGPYNWPSEVRPYLSSYWPDFDQTLKVGSWDPLEQIPTVMVTFVQATFVPETFVLFRNISPVTDPILTKLFGPNFCRPIFMLDPKCFWTQYFFGPKILELDQKLFLTKNF